MHAQVGTGETPEKELGDEVAMERARRSWANTCPLPAALIAPIYGVALLACLLACGCGQAKRLGDMAQRPDDSAAVEPSDESPSGGSAAPATEELPPAEFADSELAPPERIEPAWPEAAAGDEPPIPPPLRDIDEPSELAVQPESTERPPRVVRSLAPDEQYSPRMAADDQPMALPMEATEPESVEAEAGQRLEYRMDADPHLVRVFYATDRRPRTDVQSPASRARNQLTALLAASVAAVMGLCAVFLRRRAIFIVLALVATGVGVQQWHSGSIRSQREQRLTDAGSRVYGSDRHEDHGQYVLEVGTCDVRIPPDHRVGQVESPSIWRAEFSEDPEKHVMLLNVQPKDEASFYDELSERVAQSATRDAFVFIHGYNVSFDDAVQRTAQIAFDLKFPGAPMCYSWPSKGGFAEYTYDETNVTWTVIHLEKFLEDVRQRSGATTIHLIAHSMGNRALLQALERMSLRNSSEQPLFGAVVLAAPDVDSSEFRDRFVPLVTSVARHVTLYASSNDYALQASTRVHGYTRAGLSGEYLCVAPGLDTIDVSPIDTSLIGHSYYGDNPLMIRDMRALIELTGPASAREWLRQVAHAAGVAYWVFRTEFSSDAPPPEL